MKTTFAILGSAVLGFAAGVYIGTRVAKPKIQAHNEDENTVRIGVGKRFYYYDIPSQNLSLLFDLTPTV